MIHIVCNIDERYVEHCGVMLSSLILHNSNREFHIHILNTGLSESDKTRILQLEQNIEVKISFYDIPISFLLDFPIKKTDHLSLASYLRIFMPELLPAELNKVLYLDCDLIITDSIVELWQTDVTDVAIAGVEERPPFDVKSPQRLGYPTEFSYMNAGVMLINLKRWREMNFTQLSKTYIAENYNKIVHHDQDVINALLYNQKKFVSIRWNLMDFFLFVNPEVQQNRLDDLIQSLVHPAVIHFTGDRKPWLRRCDSPFRNLYVEIAQKNNWKVISVGECIRYYIRKMFDESLFFLHLKTRKTLRKV